MSSAQAHGQGHHEADDYDGEEGPQEIFLDDDDIAELQAAMDEEGDIPLSDEDDDAAVVEEVTEMPDGQHIADADAEAMDGDDAQMQEDIPDNSLRHFTRHENAVFSVSSHPISPVLVVSGGEDDNGYLWRTDTGEEIAKLTGHTDSVITTGWSSDGEMVATGGMDGLVRVWRRVKTTPSSTNPPQWEWARWEFLTVLEGMDEVTVSGNRWKALHARGETLNLSPTHVTCPFDQWLDWHPKGAVLICGTQDGTVWMWQCEYCRSHHDLQRIHLYICDLPDTGFAFSLPSL